MESDAEYEFRTNLLDDILALNQKIREDKETFGSADDEDYNERDRLIEEYREATSNALEKHRRESAQKIRESIDAIRSSHVASAHARVASIDFRLESARNYMDYCRKQKRVTKIYMCILLVASVGSMASGGIGIITSFIYFSMFCVGFWLHSQEAKDYEEAREEFASEEASYEASISEALDDSFYSETIAKLEAMAANYKAYF